MRAVQLPALEVAELYVALSQAIEGRDKPLDVDTQVRLIKARSFVKVYLLEPAPPVRVAPLQSTEVSS